jgi:archaemetzincin
MGFVYVIPTERIEPWVIDTVSQTVQVRLGLAINVLPSAMIPSDALDSVRHQVEATHVLRKILPDLPGDRSRAIALVEEDLFIPMLTFVFGLAQVGGRLALVSIARLRQEFYGLPKNDDVVRLRIVKETLHELGHTYGLVHCPDVRCVMSVANTVQHVDRKSSEFCGGCRSMLDETLRSSA